MKIAAAPVFTFSQIFTPGLLPVTAHLSCRDTLSAALVVERIVESVFEVALD